MDANRPGSQAIAGSGVTFDRVRQALQGRQGAIHWRRDGGGKIGGNAVSAEQPFYRRQGIQGGFHHIVACSAMDVHVDEARHEDSISKVDDPRPTRNFTAFRATDTRHHTVFHEQQWARYTLQGRVQFAGFDHQVH